MKTYQYPATVPQKRAAKAQCRRRNPWMPAFAESRSRLQTHGYKQPELGDAVMAIVAAIMGRR